MGGFVRRLFQSLTSPSTRRSRRFSSRPEVVPLEERQLLTLSPTRIVVTATPHTLTPPNGRFVPVTIAGSFAESAQNAHPSGFFYVTDQYGEIEPFGGVALQQSTTDPSIYTYSFPVHLQAKIGSMTRNGRQYDIAVGARDASGAVAKTIAVNVPKNPPHPHGPHAAHAQH